MTEIIIGKSKFWVSDNSKAFKKIQSLLKSLNYWSSVDAQKEILALSQEIDTLQKQLNTLENEGYLSSGFRFSDSIFSVHSVGDAVEFIRKQQKTMRTKTQIEQLVHKLRDLESQLHKKKMSLVIKFEDD